MTKAQLQLLEACPEAMILVEGGKPVAWNSQASRMLDWTSQSAGVDHLWHTQGGLWLLEGDEKGLFEAKVERALPRQTGQNAMPGHSSNGNHV